MSKLRSSDLESTMTRTAKALRLLVLIGVWLVYSGTLLAQASDSNPYTGLTCPEPGQRLPDCPSGKPEGHDLTQPPVITPANGYLNTSLTVKMNTQCVPVWSYAIAKENAENANKTPPVAPKNPWQYCKMDLRTYHYPKNVHNPDDTNLIPSIPGPTFRLRKTTLKDPALPYNAKTNPFTYRGDRFSLYLKNQLPNNSYPYNQCSQVHNANQVGQQAYPSCFHGPDVTNIHYHGSHVSPQEHQDYVLLKLFSSNQTNPAPPCTPSDCPPNVAIGEYHTDIPSFSVNQAPGTHWYHPHKHGSTALQVMNGMAGALLIDGPFDDWLHKIYNVNAGDPTELQSFEKLLVLQQIFPDGNFFSKFPPFQNTFPPALLVNGQATPKITMKHGEIQRWRFVGATTNLVTQFSISFPEGFEVRQIAQDGVQFSKNNWEEQPFRNYLLPSNLPAAGQAYLIGPGNRLDLLVQAPSASARDLAGVRIFHVGQTPVGNLAPQVMELINERARSQIDQIREEATEDGTLRFMARDLIPLESREGAPPPPPQARPATAVLFSIEVSGDSADMQFPCDATRTENCASWPATPYYLRDITQSEVVRTRTIDFSMTNPVTGQHTTRGVQPNSLWINKTQYDESCANETMTLGTAENWVITNDTPLFHPFHIHVNPFQLLSYWTPNRQAGKMEMVTLNHPVWFDTFGLPADVFQKDCPNTGECNKLQVSTRQRFADYSGAYVIHCHILGHEDRGMMLNVQAVCPNNGRFGFPGRDRYDSCWPPSTRPAMTQCTATPSSSGMSE